MQSKGIYIMANPKNLVGHSFNEMTANKQREIASMGGRASVEARRARKTMKQALEELLASMSTEDPTKTNNEYMMAKAIAKANRGDLKAMEFVRDTSGQKTPEEPIPEGTKRLVRERIVIEIGE